MTNVKTNIYVFATTYCTTCSPKYVSCCGAQKGERGYVRGTVGSALSCSNGYFAEIVLSENTRKTTFAAHT